MRKFKIFLPILVAIIILFILFSRIDPGEINQSFNQSNKAPLILSPLILIIAHTIGALRWKAILRILNYEANFKNIWMMYFANMPISKIIPASGGEFVRAYYLKDKVPAARHAGGIFMGILLDIFTLGSLAVFGGLIVQENIVILLGIAALTLVIGFSIFTIRLRVGIVKSWHDKLENFLYVFRNLLNNPRLSFAIVFYTFIIWFLVIIFIKIIFFVFEFDMPLLQIIAIHPIVTLISLLPISIWGIGTREAAMLFLYSGLAPAPVILSVGLTQSIIGAIVLPLIFVPLTYRTIKKIIKSK